MPLDVLERETATQRREENRRPLNLLFLTSHFVQLGGAEKNLLDLLGEAIRRGHRPVVAALKSGPLRAAVEEMNVPFFDLNVTRLASARGFGAGRWLRAFVRERAVDLVVSYHHDADYLAAVFAKPAGAAVLSSRRDLGLHLGPREIWAYRAMNRAFDGILTVSEAVRRGVIARQWAPEGRVRTVYNGVARASVESADKIGKKESLGLDPSALTVGTVASFRPVKGQEHLVRAAASVLRRVPDVQFVIVGAANGPYYEKVRELITEAGLENRVYCLGERTDVPEIVPCFDVFALPSIEEGFSNALVEAMAAGVPPVATAVGGNREAVDNRRTGFLVPPADSEALADAIVALLVNPALRRRVSDAAMRVAAARFGRERIMRQTFDWIDHLAGRKRAERP